MIELRWVLRPYPVDGNTTMCFPQAGGLFAALQYREWPQGCVVPENIEPVWSDVPIETT